MASITIKESIETVDVKDCLSSGPSHHSDDKRKHFLIHLIMRPKVD